MALLRPTDGRSCLRARPEADTIVLLSSTGSFSCQLGYSVALLFRNYGNLLVANLTFIKKQPDLLDLLHRGGFVVDENEFVRVSIYRGSKARFLSRTQ